MGKMMIEKGLFEFLIGRACWGIVAGAGTGSVVHLLMGEKFEREKPINNPTLASAVRNFNAEFSIFVECGWRVSLGENILCNSTSSNLPDEEMLIGLSELEQQTVTGVCLNPDTLDFSLSFTNGCNFSVFNDLPPSQSSRGSYSIRTPKNRYTADQFDMVVMPVGSKNSDD